MLQFEIQQQQLPLTLDSAEDVSMIHLESSVLLPLPLCLGKEEVLHRLLEMGGESYCQRDDVEFQVLFHWDACNCVGPENMGVLIY